MIKPLTGSRLMVGHVDPNKQFDKNSQIASYRHYLQCNYINGLHVIVLPAANPRLLAMTTHSIFYYGLLCSIEIIYKALIGIGMNRNTYLLLLNINQSA